MPVFLESDVWRLLPPIPGLSLGKLGKAKTLVAKMVQDGIELQGMLAQYPAVQYEPLDKHYSLLKVLGCVSEGLISDLCENYAWRGVVWAAWLAALAPDSRYRAHLVSARGAVPHNQWLVDLALSEIDGRCWRADPEFQVLVHQLRSLLSRAYLPKTRLRPSLTDQQLAEFEVERARVKSAYRSGGVESALKEIRTSRLLLYL